MRITIIAVGKVKEKFYRDAIAEFEKRLSKYCKLDIIEVADEKTPDNASEAQELIIKSKEGDRILSAVKDDMYVIALAIEGKQLSSTELADKINKLGISGKSSIAFVIGGSDGVSDAVRARADETFSFGPVTLPHNLARVVLLEQLYRAFKISRGEPYHK